MKIAKRLLPTCMYPYAHLLHTRYPHAQAEQRAQVREKLEDNYKTRQEYGATKRTKNSGISNYDTTARYFKTLIAGKVTIIPIVRLVK